VYRSAPHNDIGWLNLKVPGLEIDSALLAIFRDRENARKTATASVEYRKTGKDTKVVPCTITYQAPKKPKTTKKKGNV